MCIICVSPKGISQPTTDQIANMFARNPHGAGYMVARNGHVEIHKGFMHLPDFNRQIASERFTDDDAVVYHFRISTQAGVTPTMTHPFPLTENLGAMTQLDLLAGCGVAHNGIIQITSNQKEKTYSDTALFISRYLSRLIRKPDDLKDPAILDMVYLLAQSKLAILDASGYIATVGDFISRDGLLFSNAGFTPMPEINYTARRNYSRKRKADLQTWV